MVYICPDGGHLGTILEVLRVVGSILADVMRSSTAQERVLDAWDLRNVEVNDTFMDAFIFDEVECKAGVVRSVLASVVIIHSERLWSILREMWLCPHRGDQRSEEVDECHMHEHVIFGFDHAERGVVKQALTVSQPDFTLDMHIMRGYDSFPGQSTHSR
jgi:hypothetical protein